MLDQKETAQNSRTMLKKYRGVLMGQLVDLTNEHDQRCYNHKIGELAQDCSICHQYLEIKNNISGLGKVINSEFKCHEKQADTQSKRRYYYSYCDFNDTTYIVRAINRDNALSLLSVNTKVNDNLNQIKKINQKEAFMLIRQFEGPKADVTLKLIRNNGFYLGIVSQFNVHASLLQNNL